MASNTRINWFILSDAVSIEEVLLHRSRVAKLKSVNLILVWKRVKNITGYRSDLLYVCVPRLLQRKGLSKAV